LADWLHARAERRIGQPSGIVDAVANRFEEPPRILFLLGAVLRGRGSVLIEPAKTNIFP
jgi:hypothetical protein